MIVDRRGIVTSFGTETIRQLLAADEKPKADQTPDPGAATDDRRGRLPAVSRPRVAKGSQGAAAPLPTAQQLHERLAATIKQLQSVRMLVAQRSETPNQIGDALGSSYIGERSSWTATMLNSGWPAVERTGPIGGPGRSLRRLR